MRRNAAIRLVLAALATSVLAACADMPTGPKTPSSGRFETSTTPTTTVDTTAARSGQQGTQI